MTDVIQPQLDFGSTSVSEVAVDPMQAAIARLHRRNTGRHARTA